MNFQLKMRVDKIEENLGKFWWFFIFLKKLSIDFDEVEKIIIKFDEIKLAHKPI